MKIIRTRTHGVILGQDVTRIAKSMINIYHGRKLFEEDGTAVPGATLDLPEDYIAWDEGGCRYRNRPTRGFIHVNQNCQFENRVFSFAAFNAAVITEFNRLNRWGARKRVYTEHDAGSNQFTVEEHDAAEHPTQDVCVVASGHPFHTKYREFKFVWIVSDDPSLFQYTAPGKFPPAHNMIASMSTITVDVMHAVGLPDCYRCLGFPPLTRDVRIVPRIIYLSYRVGVDGHIYHRLGGAAPDSKRWSIFGPLFCRISAVARQVDKVHRVTSLTELSGLTCEAVDAGVECTRCGIRLFDRYYRVSINNNTAHVCKFCAHYVHDVTLELNSGRYNVAVVASTETATDLIERVPMDDTERAVVRQIHSEIVAGTLTYQNEVAQLACFSGGIVMHAGDVVMMGMCDKYLDRVLEQIHRCDEHTYLFRYIAGW